MTRRSESVHPYMKDWLWADGSLCYWRGNPNYSEKTKKKLEIRVKQMINTLKKIK